MLNHSRKSVRFKSKILSLSKFDFTLLKNMTEDKQLNLNQPLLSVRRYSSTVVAKKDEKRSTKSFLPTLPRLPPYKSELKSGPVTNPGVVPFVWEQSPGRPKDEGTLQIHEIDRPPTAPKLPPGRILKASRQDYDNAPANPTLDKNQVGNPGGSPRVPTVDEMTNGVQCSEDTVEEEENLDSGDDSEVYVDALDTLSRTESFFLNCSVSGVSGLDDHDVKPSGSFSTDPQAWDFMIGRFLPAAKAMVSETQPPQYAVPRKQPVIQDQPRQLKKVVNADKRPQLRYGPSFIQHYSQSQYNREEESDDDYDESGTLPTKVCGLLPRFCSRSSFCLLNPVPGMSVRTRVPMSPASRVQTRSSSASSCSKTENEQSSFDISEQRSTDGSQTTELHEDQKIGLNKKPKEICSDSQKLEGTYPHRHFQRGGMPHCQKESSLFYGQRSVRGICREEQKTRLGGFSSHEKNYKSFKESRANQSNSEEVDLGSPAVEKTLYIDIVHKGEDTHMKSGSSEGKELSNVGNKDNKIVKEGMKENFSTYSGHIEELSIVDGGVQLQNNFHKPRDFNLLSLANEPNQETEKEPSKALGQNEKLYLDAIKAAHFEVPDKEATKSFRKETPKTTKLENSQPIYPELPIPPPLPKSPSDSWLCRTLPSMNLKNSSLHSSFGTGISPQNHQASKTQSTDAKWETIVKTTKAQQQHFRYSEELLPPISET